MDAEQARSAHPTPVNVILRDATTSDDAALASFDPGSGSSWLDEVVEIVAVRHDRQRLGLARMVTEAVIAERQSDGGSRSVGSCAPAILRRSDSAGVCSPMPKIGHHPTTILTSASCSGPDCNDATLWRADPGAGVGGRCEVAVPRQGRVVSSAHGFPVREGHVGLRRLPALGVRRAARPGEFEFGAAIDGALLESRRVV